MNKQIEIQELGVKDYKDTWEYQELLFKDIIDLKIKNRREKTFLSTPNYFLFVEHPHVYTLGKSGDLDNLLLSKNLQSGTFRGLHFQTGPDSETKLISCVSGQMMDYLVDLRPKSKTFGRWTKIRLSSLDPSCLIIPKGVAHGYQTLDEDTTVLYGIDVKYSPENQKVLSIFDEDLSIKLELEIIEMAERDLSGLSLKEAMRFFENI